MCFKHNLTPFVCANVFVCVCKLKNFAYFSLAGGYGWFTLVHGAKYFAAFFKHNINVYTDVCIYGKYVCWGRYNGVATIKLIQNCKLFSWLYFVRSSSTRIKYFWLKWAIQQQQKKLQQFKCYMRKKNQKHHHHLFLFELYLHFSLNLTFVSFCYVLFCLIKVKKINSLFFLSHTDSMLSTDTWLVQCGKCQIHWWGPATSVFAIVVLLERWSQST